MEVDRFAWQGGRASTCLPQPLQKASLDDLQDLLDVARIVLDQLRLDDVVEAHVVGALDGRSLKPRHEKTRSYSKPAASTASLNSCGLGRRFTTCRSFACPSSVSSSMLNLSRKRCPTLATCSLKRS